MCVLAHLSAPEPTDGLRIPSPSPPNTLLVIPKDSSTFENGLDGWTTPIDYLPFERDDSGTLSPGTGPNFGALGSSWYMYCETSTPNNPNALFDMGKSYPAGSDLYGVKFYYHKYGATIGSAVLESSANNGITWDTLWSQSGNQGDQWHPVTVYALSSHHHMLKFTYTGGSSWTSDFAVDEIMVGDCLNVGCPATGSSPNNPCIIPGGTCDSATGRCSAYADGTTCDLATTT